MRRGAWISIIGLAVFSSVGWLLTRAPGPTAPLAAGGERARVPVPAEGLVGGEIVRDTPPPAVTAANDERARTVVEEGLATDGGLSLRVERAATGRAVPGVAVELVRVSRSGGHRQRRLARTGADGTALFEGVPPGAWSAHALIGGWQDVAIAGGETTRATLQIERGLTVRGRVVLGDGTPVVGAGIYFSSEMSTHYGAVIAESGAGGRFELETASIGVCVGAVHERHAPSLRHLIESAAGETVEVELELGAGAGALRGRVVDRDGQPVPGARVSVGQPQIDSVELEDGRWGNRPTLFSVGVDADGSFALRGIPGGEHDVVVRSLAFAPWRDRIRLEPGGEVVREFVLRRGGSLRGTVVSEGRVVEGATVRARGAVDVWTAKTDVAGNYRLLGITPGPVELEAVHDGFGRAAHRLSVAVDAAGRWDPVLESPHSLRGVLRDEGGAAVGGLEVSVIETEPGERTRRRYAVSAADGAFEVRGLGPEHYDITVIDPRARPRQPSLKVDRVRAAGPALELVVPAHRRANASLRGLVLAADGTPAAGAEIGFGADDDSGLWMQLADAGGRFTFGPVPAGVYRVRVDVAGAPLLERGGLQLVAGAERDVGVLQLQPAASIRLVFEDSPDGAPAEGGVWLRRDGRTVRSESIAGEHVDLTRLSPGRYDALIRLVGSLSQRVEFVLEVGESLQRTIQPVAGNETRVRLIGPRQWPPRSVVRLSVEDDAGEVVEWSHLLVPHPNFGGEAAGGGVVLAEETWWLPAGSFTVTVGGGVLAGDVSQQLIVTRSGVQPVELRIAPR